jgi:hypothetical protein
MMDALPEIAVAITKFFLNVVLLLLECCGGTWPPPPSNESD